MDKVNFEFSTSDLYKYLLGTGVGCLIILSIFLLTKTVNEVKTYTTIGEIQQGSFITVAGHGEVSTSPDLATYSATVKETEKDVNLAQSKTADEGNKLIAYLKGVGIDEKDIKTVSSYTNPMYEYPQVVCPSIYGAPCPSGKAVLVGYEVSRTFEIKLRDLTKVGDVTAGLVKLGVNNSSGPDYSIESTDVLKVQARNLAVIKARQDAIELAKSLGVKLGKISSYYENVPMNNGPVAYDMKASVAGTASTVPVLPGGTSKITSDVSITYEIK